MTEENIYGIDEYTSEDIQKAAERMQYDESKINVREMTKIRQELREKREEEASALVHFYIDKEHSGRVYGEESSAKMIAEIITEKDFEELDKELGCILDEDVKAKDLADKWYSGSYNSSYSGETDIRLAQGRFKRMLAAGVKYYKSVVEVYSKRVPELSDKAVEYEDKCIEAAGDLKDLNERCCELEEEKKNYESFMEHSRFLCKNSNNKIDSEEERLHKKRINELDQDIKEKTEELYERRDILIYFSSKLVYTKNKIDVYKNMIQKCKEIKEMLADEI